MRKMDIKKDRGYYDETHMPPPAHEDNPLDLWRHRLLVGALTSITNGEGFKNSVVLNVAGGWGKEAYLILQEGPRRLILCDISLKQAEYAKGHLKDFTKTAFVCADGEKLPLADRSVDICVITEALHHFADPAVAIGEMLRVARKAVIIDEPRRGILRDAINRIFVKTGIKEDLERGYLEAFRIEPALFTEFRDRYRGILFHGYFIYYFEWYKRSRNRFIREAYRVFLSTVNLLFHSFGNRAVVVLTLEEGA